MRYTPAEQAAMEGLVRAQMSQDLLSNLGPFLMGFAVDIAMWGTLVHQFIVWYGSKKKDRLFTRAIVYIVIVASTLVSAFSCAWMMYLFVEHHEQYFAFTDNNYIGWYPLLEAAATTPIQLFYLDRAYRLSKSRLLYIGVLPIILLHLVGSILMRALTMDTTLGTSQKVRWIWYLWSGSTLTVDVVNTSSILYSLISVRSGEEDSDRLVNRLIRLSVESQLPATLIVAGLMLSFVLEPNKPVFVFFIICHAKFYALPFMAVINLRSAIRRELDLTLEPQTLATGAMAPMTQLATSLESGDPTLTVDDESKYTSAVTGESSHDTDERSRT